MIAANLGELGHHVREQRDMLTVPAPPVPGVLHAASEALAEFCRQLSYIWRESNQVLLGAPDQEIESVRTNIDCYLRMNGLGATGTVMARLAPLPGAGQQADSQATSPDPATIARIRDVLARSDSTVAGALLPGMGAIAGDLAQQPVWDAANAAITRRISAELDKLDPVARSKGLALRRAYDAAADRLFGSRGLVDPPTG